MRSIRSSNVTLDTRLEARAKLTFLLLFGLRRTLHLVPQRALLGGQIELRLGIGAHRRAPREPLGAPFLRVPVHHHVMPSCRASSANHAVPASPPPSSAPQCRPIGPACACWVSGSSADRAMTGMAIEAVAASVMASSVVLTAKLRPFLLINEPPETMVFAAGSEHKIGSRTENDPRRRCSVRTEIGSSDRRLPAGWPGHRGRPGRRSGSEDGHGCAPITSRPANWPR